MELQGRKAVLAALLLLSDFLVATGILKATLATVGNVAVVTHSLVPMPSAKYALMGLVYRLTSLVWIKPAAS